MIREFWQERKEEKKRQKELKKQNKKNPKTKEQKAYKIFGVFFALFLIFGSIFYSCRGGSNSDGYSWDSLIGITDEIKTKLKTSVSKETLITDEQINAIHWNTCMEKLTASGLDVVTEDRLDAEKLLSFSQAPDIPLQLESDTLGALLVQMLSIFNSSQDLTLIETVLYTSGEELRLKTLMYINLTSVTIAEKLPNVYLTTDSRVEILDNNLYLLDNNFQINNLNEEDNEEVLEVIEENSLLGLEYYTTKVIENNINNFGIYINCHVEISSTKIKYVPNV